MRILFLSLCLVGCQRGAEVEHHLRGEAMGTDWKLHYSGDEIDGLRAKIVRRLDEIEDIFSTWREDSTVSRLNRGETLPVPGEYRRVLELANQVKQRSGGAFDVEVGETVREFGFGAKDAGRLDFSGIAKGFAVDELGELLEGEGIGEFLFELGGELLVRGDRDWRIGLESPDPGSVGAVRRVISLREAAVATSGTYRLFRRDANHLIDPRTGKTVAHDGVSVSVVADSCARADAWATALMVLGVEEGRTLAELLGLRAYFVRKLEGGGFEEIPVGVE